MKLSYSIIKRIFDFVAAVLGLIIVFIPWVIISIIIKIQSPGSIIYKAVRVGQNGVPFTLLKFRTMCVNSGAIHATTLRGDPRIFPFGSFLRKSKLDETPQLINILKGEMAVIGPRPEDRVNAERVYVGRYRKILEAKPGLSSPASLYDYTHGELYPSEERYMEEFEQRKLDIELYYVEHRSVIYDLQIIVRTIITIILITCGKRNFNEPREVEKYDTI